MEYITAKNKHCGGELGNKPEACQVLDSIICTNTMVSNILITVIND